MNCSNMPELNWTCGCGAVIALPLLIAALEVVYFKRKKILWPIAAQKGPL